MKASAYNNLIKNWSGVTLYLTIFTIVLTLLPSILNLLGVDFGLFTLPFSDLVKDYMLPDKSVFGTDSILHGRYVHIILVTVSISIAFLTAILSFIDFGIQKDVSTPIMGVALFCAGCMDVLHLLVAGGWASFSQGQESQMLLFTWFFSRMFHALIITLGVSIFLIRISPKKNAIVDGLTGRTYVLYISMIFILLTSMTILFITINRPVPAMLFQGSSIPQPYELLPFALYLLALFFIFPVFTNKFPSQFSKMLLLSLIPAIAAQLHMGLGSHLVFDNHFNIANYLKNLSYLIPFIGLSLNYYQTHEKEQQTLKEVNKMAGEKELAMKLLKGVLDSSTSGILAFRKISGNDEESIYKLVIANKTSQNYLESNEHEIIETGMQEILSALGLIDLHKKLSRTWVLVDYLELEHQHKHYWFHVTAVKKYNEIVITFSDITKRKNAEQSILENNQKLEVLFHQSVQLIALLDVNGSIIELNTTFLNYFNFSTVDYKDKPFWQLECWQDEPKLTSTIKQGVETASKGTLYRNEFKINIANNEVKYFDLSIKPVIDNLGKVVLLIPEARDVTQQKLANEAIEKSESRYRTLAGSLPDLAVLLFEKNYTYKLAEGQALTKLTENSEKFIGNNIEDAFSPQPVNGWIEYHHKTLKGESFQIEIKHNNTYFKVYFLPLFNNDKSVFAGLVVFYDITVIKKYQTELEHSIEELNRSNKELEQFAYVASHDLQEPLRKIRTFGERLSEKYKDALDSDATEYILRMQNASRRMQTLIDDLLSFSRISRAKPEWEKIDLEKLLKEEINDMDIPTLNQDCKVFTAKMPVIEGSPGQIRQLFQNLIGNAVKFSKKGEKNIIKVSAQEMNPGDIINLNYKKIKLPDKKYWKIAVSDKGIGFEMEYADKIFTIFQRLHGRSKFDGTGIGLSVCKKIVEHHQGIIYAESKPDEGSVFYIILPEMQDELIPKLIS